MDMPRVDRDLCGRGDGAGRYPREVGAFTRRFTREELDAELAHVTAQHTVSNSSRWLCPRCLAPSAHAGRCDKCLDQQRLGNE